MEQPIIGQINYSPDYHSIPTSQIVPNGTSTELANSSSKKTIVDFDKEYYITKVRKVLNDFLESMDELENSEMLKHFLPSTIHSYISNQRYFLTEQFTQKISEIFLSKDPK